MVSFNNYDSFFLALCLLFLLYSNHLYSDRHLSNSPVEPDMLFFCHPIEHFKNTKYYNMKYSLDYLKVPQIYHLFLKDFDF